MPIDRDPLPLGDSDTEPSVDWENEFKAKINDCTANAVDRTDGLFLCSDIEVDTDADTAGNRGLKFWLTESTWVRLLWDNTAALFKLVNQAGSLQKLSIADGTSSTHAATKGQMDTAIDALQLEVTGAIKLYGGSSAPTGYLLCDGSAVSRTTYAALFAVLGTTFGTGDGSTTFNLPDLRDRFPLGKGNMGGTAANRVTSASTGGANSDTLGGVGGAETHQLTKAELPAIKPNFKLRTAGTASIISVSGATIGNNADSTANTSTAFDNLGNDSPHNNMPPWIALPYIIKT